jgi:hypothetical protein
MHSHFDLGVVKNEGSDGTVAATSKSPYRLLIFALIVMIFMELLRLFFRVLRPATSASMSTAEQEL